MDTNQSLHSLKPSLSQLLKRTFEQLEDPKYATVPKTHFDELRPSILSKYYIGGFQERDFKSEHDLSKEEEAYANDCKDSLSKTTASTETTSQKSTSRSSKRSPRPISFRAFSWRMQPLWRYCASAVHFQYDNCTNHTEVSARKRVGLERASKTTITTSRVDQHPGKLRSQSSDQIKKSHHKLGIKMQHSMPAFEVLPPLLEDCTHSLLYQNSYLLDGVKYDYVSTKSKQQQARLYLNYMKFLKSINKSTKPTDCDVVFGEAKVIRNPSPHWESSRIDWLLNLERKQELRKLQHTAQKQLSAKSKKTIESAQTEANKQNEEEEPFKNSNSKSKKPKQEIVPCLEVDENHQAVKRKYSFLKRFKKPANCKEAPTPKVELMPTL